MKVAIQGEPGSFSDQAARTMLPRARIVPCPLSADVFERVVSGAVQAAVIPIENSLAGSVTEHLDLLLENPVGIEREFRLRIEHCLIAPPGVKIPQLRRVLSHPIALQQCRDFLSHHPKLEPVPFYDTAGSVKHIISDGLRDTAAIAGAQAAREYRAHVLRPGIEDDKQNFTRFFLVRRNPRMLPGANKTSIAFALKNVAGALFKALGVFALRELNLSKIESRPIRGTPWEYVFYVDFLGGRGQIADNALRNLREVAEFVKILGVYPAA